MIQPSLKKILIVFAMIFLLSRTGKILEFLFQLHLDEIFTLQPLRQSPERGKFFITILLLAWLATVAFCLLNKRK